MSGLILPSSYRSNPLAEYLRGRDAGDFADGVALTREMVKAVSRVAGKRHLSNKAILRAMVTTLASAVQAAAPESEWQEVGDILATEIKARLTVEAVR